MKAILKQTLKANPLLSIWVARLLAVALSFPALLARINYFGRAYVPLSVKMVGIRRIQLGKNTAIGARSWLNVNDVKGHGPALVISDNCFVGQENFFSVGKTIVLREYCLTTKSCAFIGASHVYDNPMLPYMTTGVKCESDIYIGVNCFFGAYSRVIGNVTVGHGSVIGAGAEVRNDVPPFSLVVGSPAKVIKRFDFKLNEWVKWPADDYSEGPSEDEYLRTLLLKSGATYMYVSAAAGSFHDIY